MATPDSTPFKVPNYEEKINFTTLSLEDQDFAEVIDNNKGRFNWQKPAHLVQLTKTLLKRDFNLQLKLPNDRLCPPVPIRWSYIRWIQDLVDSTKADITSDPDASRKVIGIDIGVGSSCIYSLLGCASRATWQFYGTEIDDTNYTHAVYNVTINDLDKRVHLTKTVPEDSLLPLDKMACERADFTMCNPPFFESRAEMTASFDKNTKPSAVCTGADIEMIVEGGEAKYVSKMVEESKVLGERVQWYTSQLGKLSTVPIIIEKLKELQCVNWAVGVLNPNEQTRRWVVGWSWGDMRPANEIARNEQIHPKGLLPWPTEYHITIDGQPQAVLSETVNSILTTLSLQWLFDTRGSGGLGIANGDVWSRHARRKRKRDELKPAEGHPLKASETMDTDNDEQVALAFCVTIQDNMVKLRWLKGADTVLWDSFCGMMRRKLTGNPAKPKMESGQSKLDSNQ